MAAQSPEVLVVHPAHPHLLKPPPRPIPMPDTQPGMHHYTEIQGYVPTYLEPSPFLQQASSILFSLPPPITLYGLSFPQSSAPLSCVSLSLSLPISAASLILVPQTQKHPMPPKSLPL